VLVAMPYPPRFSDLILAAEVDIVSKPLVGSRPTVVTYPARTDGGTCLDAR